MKKLESLKEYALNPINTRYIGGVDKNITGGGSKLAENGFTLTWGSDYKKADGTIDKCDSDWKALAGVNYTSGFEDVFYSSDMNPNLISIADISVSFADVAGSDSF